MAFTLLSEPFVQRGIKTVIQSGSTGGFSFQLRNYAFAESEVRQWGWVYNFWDTGNVDVGRVILQQVRLNQARHSIVTQAVPEGTQGLIVYVTEKAPEANYTLALYRRL